jgi:hypothetical protein
MGKSYGGYWRMRFYTFLAIGRIRLKSASICAWPKSVGSRFGMRQAVFHMKHSEYEGVAHAGNEAAAAATYRSCQVLLIIMGTAKIG